MRVILENESVRFELSKTENADIGAYMTYLLSSNNVSGAYYYADKLGKYVVVGNGANENIYSALTQLQNESVRNYFEIH